MELSNADIYSNKEEICKLLFGIEYNELVNLKIANEKLKSENQKLKELLELNKKKIGDHSMYKGEFQEKKIEYILLEYLSSNFEILGDKHMKCMDIRIKHKLNNYLIGIECKHKKKLTKTDIEKFKNDKIHNNFKAGIFISTSAPIKDYVNQENSYKLVNNELYIYSNDQIYIILILQYFLNCIENTENKISVDTCIDYILNLYSCWNCIKKNCQKMDTEFLQYLNRLGLENENGHLFIISKNKCKNNKIPYEYLEKDIILNDTKSKNNSENEIIYISTQELTI
jgi:hypothetical protein